MTTATIGEFIRHRRSIYPNMYSGEKVDDEIVIAMLDNADWAPTHRLTTPWRFIVFKDEGIKALADYQSDLYKEKSSADNTFSEEKFTKLKTKPLLCSHIISIGMKRDPKESVPEIEEISAVACAVQNMWLTASAHGVGCYWGSGGITYMKEALPYFDLGDDDLLLGFLYLGMPRTKWPEGKRKGIDDKVSWRR